MICIENLVKSFGSQTVLRGVNLRLERGETIGIVGPSGTGKSVLLKLITSLLAFDSGSIQIDGLRLRTDMSTRERMAVASKMGVLFQGAALLDSLSLWENLVFPLRWSKKHTSKEVSLKAHSLLEQVGLRGMESYLPGEVPIGVRKRLGIARALIVEPEIILFDEPNTGLDPEVGQEIYDLMKETRKARTFTGIVISHEIPEVYQVCDRVAMLYAGVVVADAPVEDFPKTDNAIVQQFINGRIDGPIRPT